MTRGSSVKAALALGFGLLAASAAGGAVTRISEEREPLPDAAPAPAYAVPRPELGAMEEAARRKIESMQERLEQLTAREDAPPELISEGFGALGRMFHAYRLLDAAADCYGTARSMQPEDHRWAYLLGLVRNAAGDFEAALADYEAALELKPDDFPTFIRMGNALLELGRLEEARARFEQALERSPGNAAAIYGLGKASALAGDHAAAARHFERVLELQPDATVVHYPLGQAYRRLGDLEAAREQLQQRGKQEVRFPDPLGNQVARLAKGTALDIVLALAGNREDFTDEEFLGFALSQFGEVEGSAGQVRQWLDLQNDPAAEGSTPQQRARLRYVLGGLLVNDGEDEAAMAEFRAALELDPGLLDARIKLGNAIARAGRFEEAAAEYGAVLETDPDRSTALLKRAAAWMALERHEEARADLDRLVEIEPENSEAQLRLAAALEAVGEPEAAIERYRRAAELDLKAPERAQLHDRLGRLLRRRGDAEGAIEEFRRALEANPESPSPLAALASQLAQLGRFAEAADLYRRWVDLQPDILGPRVAEASALILSGRHEAARERLEAALESFPEELQLMDILARHLAACPDPTVRDGERAVEFALGVFEKLPTDESAETVAMAYAEAGQFEEAIRWQEELIGRREEDGEEGDAASLERLRRHLELYRTGNPCCG